MPWEKQFDVDKTLEKAGQTFWAQGYEATSMRDLLGAMGIQKGSFYNTYGSKHELYVRSLEQYAAARLDDFEQLTKGRKAVDALCALFEAIYKDCTGPMGHRGCMVINCALELAHDDPKAQAIVKRAIAHHESLMRDLIRAGQETGDIDPALDACVTAKAMMSFIMGMRIYSRSGGDQSAVRILVDQALGLVIPRVSNV